MSSTNPKKAGYDSPENETNQKEAQSRLEDTNPNSMPGLSTDHGGALDDDRTDGSLAANVTYRDIGPYRIIEKIGEGGMGSVYRAQQEQPIRRQVALKVIKAGRNSQQIITRFEAERQAVAMMDHPNIAKILDAGTTEDGSPYFAMELVDGVPFNQYCDDRKLSIRDRLELFMPVCQAVQHAHQKGIIHRDLKPSNVLVGLYDGIPIPKVIDFGLAKAVEHQELLTDKSMFTELGKVVGTLQFMSPEQAETSQLDIDTRTDIYSLGVMLYELLTGSIPLDSKAIGKKALLQVLEIIRDEEPPRPSIRLSDSSDTISSVSEDRQIEPKQLQQILRGDLDWIVMKAIEKDRNRRYETANGLANDIQRFLCDEPITARPPSNSYRIKKFAKKNRGLVVSAASILFLLVAGITGTTWGLLSANASAEKERIAKLDAEDQKELAQQEAKNALEQKAAADKARDEAQVSAKRSDDVLQIVTDSFESVDPTQGADADMKAKDVLFNANDSLAGSELDERGRIRLLESLTASFLSLGEFESAISTSTELIDLRKTTLGPFHFDTLDSQSGLGRALVSAGRVDDAIELNQLTFKMLSEQLGPASKYTIKAAHELAKSLTTASRYDEALPILEANYQITKDNFGESDEFTLQTMQSLAIIYATGGKPRKAIEIQTKVFDSLKSSLGDEHADTIIAMGNLALSYSSLANYDKAIELFRKTLVLAERVYGEDHEFTLTVMNNMAIAFQRLGRYPEAILLLKKNIDLRIKKGQENHPTVLSVKANLANFYISANKVDQALVLSKSLIEKMKQEFGPNHLSTLANSATLAAAYRKKGQLSIAIPLYEETIEALRDNFDESSPQISSVMNGLALCYQRVDRVEEAITLYKKCLEISRKVFGDNNRAILPFRGNLARAYSENHQVQKAIEIQTSSLELSRRVTGNNSRDTAYAMRFLAESYMRTDKYVDAIKLLDSALGIFEDTFGRDNPETQFVVLKLGQAYLANRKFDDAIEFLEEADRSSAGIPMFPDVRAALRGAYAKNGNAYKLEAAITIDLAKARKSYETNSDELKGQLTQYGHEFLTAEDYKNAEKLLRESIEIGERIEPDRWKTFAAKCKLGAALVGQEKFDEARPLLEAGYQGLKKQSNKIPQPIRKKEISTAILYLLDLARLAGDDNGQKKWQAELESFTAAQQRAETEKPTDTTENSKEQRK